MYGELARRIRKQTFGSRQEFTMAFVAFTVATLRCVAYCNPKQNYARSVELKHIRCMYDSVQSEISHCTYFQRRNIISLLEPFDGSVKLCLHNGRNST